jgi:hypothetical protein
MGDDTGKRGEGGGHATVDQVHCAGFWVSTGLLRNAYIFDHKYRQFRLAENSHHNYCGNRRLPYGDNCVEPLIGADLSSVTCYDSLSFLHDELCVAAAADRGVLPQRVQHASRQQPKPASFCMFYSKTPTNNVNELLNLKLGDLSCCCLHK